jgi:glucuronoarabinoxylan endo-1,4-beta-xylanase
MMFKKFKMSTKRALAAALTFAVGATAVVPAAAPAEAASDVVVNTNTQYQVMRGFGGMNFPTWGVDLTDSQTATAFGNSDNQLGMNILRIHVDPVKSNWSRELKTAKAAQQRGAIVFATPWTPPSSMTEPTTWNGKRTVRLRHDQ